MLLPARMPLSQLVATLDGGTRGYRYLQVMSVSRLSRVIGLCPAPPIDVKGQRAGCDSV